MGRSRLYSALLFASALIACGDETERVGGPADSGSDSGSAPVADAGSPKSIDLSGFDRALEQAIATHNETALEADKVRGASAVVVHKEHGILHTAGYLGYAPNRLYLIASSGKILSAGILMRLADQGLLDLDEPVSRYLASWPHMGAGNVTVAQMLSNSSGLWSLLELTPLATMPSDPNYYQLCQYTPRLLDLKMCAQFIYNVPPKRTPDTSFAYGGSQWQLAGAVAEVVSQKSWATLVDETYKQPCDVPSLGFTNQYEGSARTYPATFMGDVSKLPVAINPNIEGGSYITVPDYGKLLLMFLRGGKCGENRVLSEAAVARMQENRVKRYGTAVGGIASGYGFGWWVDEAQKVVYDPGAYGGFSYLDLERGYGAFIAFENSSTIGSKIGLMVKPTLDALIDANR